MSYDLEHPPWATPEFDFRSENWGDEQDRSEWFEEAASHYARKAAALEDELADCKETLAAAEAALRAYDPWCGG